MTRNRRQPGQDRSRARNRIRKLLHRSGIPLGGVLSDIFGRNSRSVLDGRARGTPADEIAAGLSPHVRGKRDRLHKLVRVDFDAEARAQLQAHLRACDHATRHRSSHVRIHRT